MQAQTTYEMNVTVNGQTIPAQMGANPATAGLKAMLESGNITVDVHAYGGFERVGSLPASLTTSDERIDATTGDIVLYLGNQIVFMLGSNSWSYTRLGHIDADQSSLEAFFGAGNSTVILSLPTATEVDALTQDDDEVAQYFDMHGRKLSSYRRGPLIIKKGNKTSKVFRK